MGLFKEPPEKHSLTKVDVRLAEPEERPLWDALMDGNHDLGFRRLAGRGLRHVATFGDRWRGLAAWQHGAFKCAPRDRWTGWKPEQQFQRLDMIANHTRFLILSEPRVFPNLASRFLAAMARRRPDDWLQAYGHKGLLAETFCDPECFTGSMYAPAGWEERADIRSQVSLPTRSNSRHRIRIRRHRTSRRQCSTAAQMWFAMAEVVFEVIVAGLQSLKHFILEASAGQRTRSDP